MIVDLVLKFNSTVKEEKVLSMLKDSAENGGPERVGCESFKNSRLATRKASWRT